MPMFVGFRDMERMWDPANSTAVDKRRGAHKVYPASRPLGGGSLYPASNLVYDIVVFIGCRRRRRVVCLICIIFFLGGASGGFIYAAS
jgi:hypothetical protein